MWFFNKKKEETESNVRLEQLHTAYMDIVRRISKVESDVQLLETNYVSVRNRINRYKKEEQEEESLNTHPVFNPFGK
jgi:hypothetical protein